MLYPLLIGIFFLTQQGLQGASADLPEPDIEGTKLTLVEANKELKELVDQWISLHNRTFPSEKPKRFSLPLSTNSAPKRTSKPSANDLLLLDLAKRYEALREEFPQLPANQDIGFFLLNCVPNGPIAKFQFNHPNSLAVVTKQSQGYQADVDWAKYCPYAGVQVDQETGEVVVLSSSPARSRSTSNPVVVQPKPHRIERAVSHPPRPEVSQRKRLDSGYSSEQSIRSWQSGNTWFAEV